MQRRKFSREFWLEAVRLVRNRGVAIAEAARNLNVHENVLRRWTKEFAVNPGQAFPGHGEIKPEQMEIDRLRREVGKLKADHDILIKPPSTSRSTEGFGRWRGCAGLSVSRKMASIPGSTGAPSQRARGDDVIGSKVRGHHVVSYRTYCAHRVSHELLAEGISYCLHQVERLMRAQGLRARPHHREQRTHQGER